MDYMLIMTGNGYDQVPVKEKFIYKNKEYKLDDIKPYQWYITEEEDYLFYLPGQMRYFQCSEEITVAKQNADIIISDLSCAIELENSILKIYGANDESELFINRKRVVSNQDVCELVLNNGDQILIRNVYIIYHTDYIELYSDNNAVHIHLEECNVKNKYFEGFPHYTRSPRLIKNVPRDKVEIKKAPAEVTMPKGSLLQTILPSLIMLCITIAVSILMKRGLFVVMSIASTVMTLIFTINKYINDKKDCKEKTKVRKELYKEYLLKKRKEIYELHQKETDVYKYNYPNICDIERMIHNYSNRIYERNAHDDDFLLVSIGKCKEKVSFSVHYDYDELKMDKDEMEEQAKNVGERFAYIEEKPITVSLKNAHLGLIGEKELVHEQLKLLMAQLTFQQSYHDLQIVLIHDKKYNEAFRWMRWYPHLRVQSLNMTGDINSEQMRDQILGSLFQILKDRFLKVEENNKQSKFLPHFLFIIDEPKLIMDHSIMEYLNKSGQELGFSIIYTSYLRGNLPDTIGTVIEIQDSKEATLVLDECRVVNKKFELYHVENCNLEWMARDLSVLIHDLGVTSKIPESITFFDMYGIKKPEQLNAEKRWNQNQSHKTLAVPLGVRAENDIVYLNLHEKAHGPHGLVAGTTGSGKSEIIQSYILSLAVNFHPYEVGFLLIDYKGGGMAGLFKNLPHLLGTITNLDGSESQRALASIKSELARRQRIFGQNNVNHINAYNKLFKDGEVKEPIPHLFLISDEFAELKKEQPEFMTELVSTARIGRSLGIHLILATQKPTGVVNDQIWTNSKFKLALKVQDESDSREIIKTSDAAYITQAGRAYLQVGNNEIYELFQSAWSGAEYTEDGVRKVKDNRVYLVNALGQGELLNEDLSGMEESTGIKATQLDVTVDYLKMVFEQLGVESVRKPWLPSLPHILESPLTNVINETQWNKVIAYDKERTANMSVPLGMIDIPEEQSQREYIVDLAKDGNVVYMASAGYGKTMFLMTAVISLALQNQVEDLNFYILDFGNSALIPLNALPHTADYILYDDTEKFNKFVNIIQEEIAYRKRLLAENMVQNFTVYNQTSESHMKAIVVVVDNFDVVRELGAEAEAFFTKLSRDGAGLGIFLIMTATRVNAVKYSIINNFKIKIAGYLYDQNEANSLVGRCEYKLPEIRGRALVKTNNINIMQVYTMVKFGNDIEYNQKIKDLIQKIAVKYPNRKAARIPILPERFTHDMLNNYAVGVEGPDLTVGLEVEAVTKVGFTRMHSPFVIIGESGKGKTNMLKVLLHQIIGQATAYVFDSSAMGLYAFHESEGICYVQNEDVLGRFIESMKELCAVRKLAFKEELNVNGATLPTEFYRKCEPVYIIIDDMDQFLIMGKGHEAELLEVLQEACECGVGIAITVHAAKLKSIDPLAKWVKATAHGLVLSAQGTLNIFPVRLQREYPQMGYGLLFHNGEYVRVKLPEYIKK